jgi:methenyltetrahydrofolate cyclohydrolase
VSEVTQQTIEVFLEELASKSATPGGGSAAALMGAQGAALVSMVCRLTIGKPKFAEVEAQMQQVLTKSEALRAKLTDFIQADINIFNRLMAAYALPKESEDEKLARSEAIQEILKIATEVPLQCAFACAEVIELAKIAAEKGSPTVISDAGAGVMVAYAGLKSSALNVYINAGSLKDRLFAEAKLAELDQGIKHIEAATLAVYDNVTAKL